jgi:hypothetical protein
MTCAALVSVLAVVVACGGGGGGGGGGDDDLDARTTPPIDATPDPTVVETRRAQIGPIDVEPGAEQTVCVIVDLGNDVPRMVRAVHSILTPGTHHVIATLSSSAPAPVPTPCGAFAGGSGGGDSAILTIAQQSDALLAYPSGAGVPIGAHQSIHLEMHYLNTTDQAMAIGGTVDLDLAEASAGLRAIDFLFTGNPSLFIASGSSATVTSFHPLRAGSELFATTAHTHQWGRRATVELATSATDPAARLLHDSTSWAERPLDQFDPIVITEGQGLRLTCNFQNDSGHDVGFGLSAEDEMCFVWAHSIAAP